MLQACRLSRPACSLVEQEHPSWLLALGAVAGVAGVGLAVEGVPAAAADSPYSDSDKPGLPAADVDVSLADTALVVTDSQIDFLDPKGVMWDVVGPKRYGAQSGVY
jgi:hypothetical protein